MDWEKATKIGTVCSIGGLAIGLYSIMPSTSGSSGGSPVKSLVPSIIIGTAIFLASIFNLLAFFMRRRKLQEEINKLTTANEGLTDEKRGLNELLRNERSEIAKLNDRIIEAERFK